MIAAARTAISSRLQRHPAAAIHVSIPLMTGPPPGHADPVRARKSNRILIIVLPSSLSAPQLSLP
jgi:hypothetical protein